MAWTSPRTWVAGEVPTAATFNTHVRDNLKAIGDPWTSYAPTLTGFTVSSSAAYYSAHGKHITVSYICNISTTSGVDLGVSLPFAPARTPMGIMPVGPAMALDSGTTRRHGQVLVNTTSPQTARFNSDNSASLWSSTVPFTWVAGDQLAFTAVYEAV